MISTKFTVKNIWRISLVLLIISFILIPLDFINIIIVIVNYFRLENIFKIINKMLADTKYILKILLVSASFLGGAKLLLIITRKQRKLRD
jgi:hypothetical protein